MDMSSKATATRLVALTVVTGLSQACAPSYRLEPASGGTVAKAMTAGFQLTASANSWAGGRGQLAGRVLPIWVQLSNRSNVAVRVRYTDVGAVDEQGFWFAAIDPRTGQVALPAPVEVVPRGRDATPLPEEAPSRAPRPPETDPGAPTPNVSGQTIAWMEEEAATFETASESCFVGEDCAEVALIPVWRDVTNEPEAEQVGHRGGAGSFRGGFLSPHAAPRAYGFGYGPGYPYGYYGGYYGQPWNYGYWGWGWPYYGSGYYWPYYAQGAPPIRRLPTTATMIDVGLVEGELKPGTTTAGFVYFPSPAKRSTQLDVTWAVHSPDAQLIAEVGARFVSIEDE